MPVSVKVGGAWKAATAVYNKVGGVWKTAADMPVKIAGVWKTGILEMGSFESIATATGTGSSPTITFSSIPSTYKHLQIRYMGAASGVDRLFMRFNSDSAQNYASHMVLGYGSGATTNVSTTSNQIAWAGYVMDTNVSATTMAVGVIDIHDYASTTKNKTTRTTTGYDLNGSGIMAIASGLWMSTSAITSITLFPQNSPNWTTSTRFALYGIKGE